MFFNAPKNPTKLKRAVYLTAATALGLLLSLIAHALIEINYLRYAMEHGLAVTFVYGCALPPALNLGLTLAGALGGFMLGRFWWRLVYVDRVWAKKYKARR